MPKKSDNVGMAKHLWQKTPRTLWYCAEISKLPPILHLTYLVNADLFLDIVSTIFCLGSVNYFNSHSLLRKSVHQQPDPGSKEKLRMKRMQQRCIIFIYRRKVKRSSLSKL